MDPLYDLVVVNGRIVSATSVSSTDVWLGAIGQTIACISSTPPPPAKRVIDAQGAFVTPGGVDTHVHLQQLQVAPGEDTGDTFETGTRSAVAGGTTTIVAFANQQRTDESLRPLVQEYHRRAESGKAYADYGFHMILTRPTRPVLDELDWLVRDEGITSLKVYMTYEARRVGDRDMLEIMLRTRALGMTLMVHAENDDMVQLVIDHLKSARLTEPLHHALARTPLAESEATNRAICLSQLVAAPTLIVHVSQAEAMARIRRAQDEGNPIFAETCPQYLLLLADAMMPTSCACAGHVPLVPDNFTTQTVDSTGKHADGVAARYESAKMVCSPPLRESKADLDAVWRGVKNGTVTTFSSDHCPSAYDHPYGKMKGLADGDADFTKIPNGLPGVETRMPLLMTYGVEQGRITPQRLVQLCATQPAHLYGLQERKGELAAGMDADIVIWYPPGTIREPITNAKLHHGVDYTPFEGVEVTNWPRYTILRGEVAYDRDGDGVVLAKGQYVKRVKGTMGWEERAETHLERIARLGEASHVSL